MNKKTLLVILFVLSFLAIVDSSLITYEHYSKAPLSFCKFGKNFDCGIAAQSPYATVDNIFYFLAVDLGLSVPIVTIGIPVAIMAIVVFLLIKIGALHIWHEKDIGRFNTNHMIWSIRGLLIFSLLYGISLIYVQAFILRTYCLYCLLLDALILASLIISFRIKTSWKRTRFALRN